MAWKRKYNKIIQISLEWRRLWKKSVKLWIDLLIIGVSFCQKRGKKVEEKFVPSCCHWSFFFSRLFLQCFFVFIFHMSTTIKPKLLKWLFLNYCAYNTTHRTMLWLRQLNYSTKCHRPDPAKNFHRNIPSSCCTKIIKIDCTV